MFFASLQQKNEKIYDKFGGALLHQNPEKCSGVGIRAASAESVKKSMCQAILCCWCGDRPGSVGGKCE